MRAQYHECPPTVEYSGPTAEQVYTAIRAVDTDLPPSQLIESYSVELPPKWGGDEAWIDVRLQLSPEAVEALRATLGGVA